MRQRDGTQRAAIARTVIAVIAIVVVAAAAGGFYLLASMTSASITGPTMGTTAPSQATGSIASSTSVRSVVTTSSVGAQNLTDLYQNLASGLNEPQDLIGNYSELSYAFSTEYLNHSGGQNDYSSTYSVLGQVTPDGVPATKVGVSFTNESTYGGLMRNNTQQYTIDLDRNGTVIQLYNETSHEYKQIMNTDTDMWLLTQGTEGFYGYAVNFFQNSTFFQQVGTTSLTIGTTTLAVSSFSLTPAFFSSETGNFPGDTLTIGIGIAPGTTLHIPTSIVVTGEASPGNSSSWERVTFTLTDVAAA